jgi:signal transduction histidine kinase
LARLEEDNLPKERVAITDVAKKAADVVALSAEIKDIKVLTKLPKNENAVVMADESSLTELLVILLDNAVKYSPEKSKVTLKVSFEGKHVVVSVADEGVGISADHLPHIFDRFYRADSSRTGGETHGYGLGLALAQKIAQLHKTTITVTSKQGKGSTFAVQLPAV